MTPDRRVQTRRLVSLTLAAVLPAAVATEQADPAPVVISARAPIYPQIAILARVTGVVRARVTTQGTRVRDVEILDGIPLLNPAVIEALRTWQVALHGPSTFDVRVTFGRKDEPPSLARTCPLHDENTWVRARLPAEIEVLADPPAYCYSREPDLDHLPLRAFDVAGVVRCDCPGGQPLADVSVSLRRLGSRGARLDDGWVVAADDPYHERVHTDAEGRFAIAHVPPGWYRLDLGAALHFRRAHVVFVDRRSSAPDLALSLRPDPHNPPLPAIAVRGDVAIPRYPADARASGLAGDVRLRLAADGEVSVLSGPPTLARAAREYVEQLSYRRTRQDPLLMTVRYRLAGPCEGGAAENVRIEFPHTIEIVAPACGGR